jgi:hypothetical protein
MNQCYICLELTDTVVIQDCRCVVHTHQSCYEEWLRQKEICIICKKSVYPNIYSNTFSSVLKSVDPFIDSFMYDQMNAFQFLIFLCLSFLTTILLVTPLCILTILSKKDQFRKIRFARRTAC